MVIVAVDVTPCGDATDDYNSFIGHGFRSLQDTSVSWLTG
jgi:hypothetical protein